MPFFDSTSPYEGLESAVVFKVLHAAVRMIVTAAKELENAEERAIWIEKTSKLLHKVWKK